jgi:hypothetical protein
MTEGVQFEEWRPPQKQYQPTKTVRWLIKFSGGLIKTERQANFVLVIIMIAVIIATILVLTLGGPKSPGPSPLPAEEFPQTLP